MLHTRNPCQSIIILHNITSAFSREVMCLVKKEVINAKVSVAASRKKDGKMFTRSNQCSSHVGKGAPAMTSGPFCHEHGGGRFIN